MSEQPPSTVCRRPQYLLLLDRVADLLVYLPALLLALLAAILAILAPGTLQESFSIMSLLNAAAATGIRIVVLITKLLDDDRSS